MDYRQLGRTGLRVSTFTLGTMGFGSQHRLGAVDVEGAARQLDIALDAGVNLVDTANIYTLGVSETLLGRVLKDRRDRALVATKVRSLDGRRPQRRRALATPHHRVGRGEPAADRHRPHRSAAGPRVGWPDAAGRDAARARRSRTVGQGPLHRLLELHRLADDQALGISERDGLERFASQQIHYTPQSREAEFELLPAAIDQGVGTLLWSPLAGGLLSGKYRRGQAEPTDGSRHVGGWTEPPIYDEDALYDLIDVLVEVADHHGASAAQVTLAWLLDRPGVTSVVVGARTEEQLRDNLAAAALRLTDEERTRIEEVSRPPLPYPLWHQAAGAADRLSPADLSVLERHLS